MSMIAQYRAAELALAQQITAFEELKQSPELKKELEFSRELDTFLAKYSMTKIKLQGFLVAELSGTVAAFEKKPVKAKPAAPKEKAPRKNAGLPTGPRPMKRYTNPHTNEVIESGRRDHKVIKGWIEQHGQDTVDSWAVVI